MKKKSRIHKSQLQRATRPLTPAQLAQVDRVRKSTARDKARILATLDELAQRYEQRTVALGEALQLIREARQSQGVTLPELAARAGIGKGALSRLENDPNPNPTLRTLHRLAEALDKKIVVGLEDSE